jgi:hypothetical protein
MGASRNDKVWPEAEWPASAGSPQDCHEVPGHAVTTVLLVLCGAELPRCDTLPIPTEQRHCFVETCRAAHLCLPEAPAAEHVLAWDQVKQNGLAEKKISSVRAWRWPKAERRSGQSYTLSHAQVML